MKKIISIFLVIMLMMSLVLLTGCSKKDEEQGEVVSDDSAASKSKVAGQEYSWPEMKGYEIPKLDKCKISSLNDNCNVNGYGLNYDIMLESVKKSDIDEYVNSFDESWIKTEVDDGYILVSSEKGYQSSVVISLDEKNEVANIAISTLE